MPAPADPKIYHIVHVDRLPSIIADGGLLCDAEIAQREPVGTTIGMNDIKQRRLTELRLNSRADLHVGACVPFYQEGDRTGSYRSFGGGLAVDR